jgi:hypothetical protein
MAVRSFLSKTKKYAANKRKKLGRKQSGIMVGSFLKWWDIQVAKGRGL